MFLGLPLPDPRLQYLVRRRRRIHHVAHPRVPPRLDLAGVVLFVFVVDPARAERELFGRVLKVAVTITVGADEGASFGVACLVERRGDVSWGL
jgi:hypothetical protein